MGRKRKTLNETESVPTNSEVEELLNDATAKLESLNCLVTSLRNENDELKSEIKAMKMEIDNHKKTIGAMTDARVRRECECEYLRDECSKLRELNEKLESEIEVVKSLCLSDRVFHWKDIVKNL